MLFTFTNSVSESHVFLFEKDGDNHLGSIL
jgi:hypothetical protein